MPELSLGAERLHSGTPRGIPRGADAHVRVAAAQLVLLVVTLGSEDSGT